jgi:hypothetical protein
MAVRVWELRGSECCPVIGQIQVASPRWDNITSPETELTSRWCSNSRTFVEPMSEAKQMTAAQAAGAASHTMVVFLHRRASWPQTSIEKVLFDVEYSRVLVFQGGVIECSSRMTGNCQVRFLEGWPPAMGAGYSAEQMQTLASVVTRRERKMLGALFAVGTEGCISSVMGNTTLPAYRGHLNYLTCPISGTE